LWWALQNRTSAWSGGFGVAYLARDWQERQVVIKTLRDEILIDPKNKYFCDRFKDEALRLAVCRHPHIVAVQNTFTEPYALQIENKVFTVEAFCLVMEYIEGESLEQIVRRRRGISEGEVVCYLHQIGSALAFVHDLGILHRDIKPSNILIRSTLGEAVLIDFGLARNFIHDSAKNYTVALTHGFAPPEQYSRKVVATEAVDVYALAATAYFALTGTNPISAMDRLLAIPQPTVQELTPNIGQKLNSDEHSMDSADISALLRQVLAMYSDYNSLQTQVDYFVLNLNKPLLYGVVADICCGL